jgi:hypothetical protein
MSKRLRQQDSRFCQFNDARRASHACEPCKRIKQKCGDLRPCPRCVRNGRQDACISDQGSDQIERPLPWGAHNSILFHTSRPFPIIKPKHQWACKTIYKIWAAGYQVHGLVKILDSLSPKLACASARALEMLQGSSNVKLNQLSHNMRIIGMSGNFDGNTESLERLAQEAEMWEAQTEYGFWQFVLDPATQERRGVFINSRFAEQCGFHKEEMLARLANYEAEVPRPDLDTLRVFLDDFNHLLDDSSHAPIER